MGWLRVLAVFLWECVRYPSSYSRVYLSPQGRVVVERWKEDGN